VNRDGVNNDCVKLGCFLIVRLMCIVRGHIRTKILSTKGRRKKHNFISGITGYRLAIYHTERKNKQLLFIRIFCCFISLHYLCAH